MSNVVHASAGDDATGRRRGFVSGGSWTVDRIKVVDHWPTEETLARITATDQQGGGSAHNFGVDIRKLDPAMPVEGIGLVGDDPDGELVLERARQVGIDSTQLHRTRHADTSYTDVMTVAGSGKRTFFHHPGTSDLLSPDHFDFTSTSGRILHLGLLGIHRIMDGPWGDDANGWVTVLKRAKAAGLATNLELVSIGAEQIRQVALPCLAHVDTLIVNDHEIGSLASVATLVGGRAEPERCREAALTVLDQGAVRLVAVHYPEGAVCVTRDGETFEQPSVDVPAGHIGSTVGAGDAFAAGMLYALHEDWPVVNALELAHATAAMSLRSPTTVGSVADVDTCLAEAGFRRP